MTLWVMYRTGRWHAWQKEAGHTTCKQLNTEHLRQHPPLEVAQVLATEHLAVTCIRCLRRLGRTVALVSADEVTRAWVGFIRLHLTHTRVQAGKADVQAIAERLAAVGTPDDQDALRLWEQVRVVLLTPLRFTDKRGVQRQRLTGLKKALELLPPGGDEIYHVANVVRTWRRVMGHAGYGRIKADRVVEGMLSVPDPEPYLEHLRERGFTTLSSVFSPGVLSRTKKEPELRGLWDGGDEYWDATLDDLNIVTDDDEE